MTVPVSDGVDYVAATVYVTSETGEVVTACHVSEAWRIGPRAVEWHDEDTITLPLSYPEVLPAGRYVERVRVFGHNYRTDGLEPGSADLGERGFEVTPAGIFPITADVGSGAAPCRAEFEYTDAVELDQATTVIDADQWDSAGSIQPIRWLAGDPNYGPSFVFRSFTANESMLALRATVPASPEPPKNVTVRLGEGQGLLEIAIDPNGLEGRWTSVAGEVEIEETDSGEWEITFSDVELASDFVGGPSRSIPTGTIRGALLIQR